MAPSPDKLTHEENVLYLIVELDEALVGEPPRWAPEQMDVAKRRMASLVRRLLAIIPRS